MTTTPTRSADDRRHVLRRRVRWIVTATSATTWAERRAGRELGSATAVADSKQTLICAYLSAAVLVGLVLNSVWGWWWADAIAGLVIAAFAIREGTEAWRGDACATSVGMLLEDEHDDERPEHSTTP